MFSIERSICILTSKETLLKVAAVICTEAEEHSKKTSEVKNLSTFELLFSLCANF
jgi:hypothetical protein